MEMSLFWTLDSTQSKVFSVGGLKPYQEATWTKGQGYQMADDDKIEYIFINRSTVKKKDISHIMF